MNPSPHPEPERAAADSQTEGIPTASPVLSTSGEGEPDSPHVLLLAPPQGTDEIGRLAHYRILRELGAGGMGLVFQAEDTTLDRLVALKVMHGKVAENPLSRDRFLREAKAAAAVKHEHIVTIHQVGEDRGIPFIALEFLQGEPLDAWLRTHTRAPVGAVLRIGREIAEGLAAAHARGLIHRDIKPANIWLEAPKGRVKILDFGLARPTHDDTQLTREGAIVGTPAYMSPEQARGDAVDARSDLFSLGVVLYRMLTGVQPFTGNTTMAVLMSLGVDNPPPVIVRNPEVPAAFSDLVTRLLSKDIHGRPESAAQVVAILEAIEASSSGHGLGGSGTVPVVVMMAPPAAEESENPFELPGNTGLEIMPIVGAPEPVPKSASKLPWIAAGLGLLVLAGIGVFFALGPKGKADPTPVVQSPPGPRPPAVIQDEIERPAAKKLNALADLVLRLPGDRTMLVEVGKTLPEGPFTIQEVRFTTSGLNWSKFGTEYLPLLTAGRTIESIVFRSNVGGTFVPGDMELLAAAPLAGTLRELDVDLPLSPTVVNSFSRFPRLAKVRLNLDDSKVLADVTLLHATIDALGLAKSLRDVTFTISPKTVTMRDALMAQLLKTLATMPLTKLKIRTLVLQDAPHFAAFATSTIETLDVGCGESFLPYFAKMPNLETLLLYHTTNNKDVLTQEGLESLNESNSLRELTVTGTVDGKKVTKVNLEDLAERLPRVTIIMGTLKAPAREPRPPKS